MPSKHFSTIHASIVQQMT